MWFRDQVSRYEAEERVKLHFSVIRRCVTFGVDEGFRNLPDGAGQTCFHFDDVLVFAPGLKGLNNTGDADQGTQY